MVAGTNKVLKDGSAIRLEANSSMFSIWCSFKLGAIGEAFSTATGQARNQLSRERDTLTMYNEIAGKRLKETGWKET